MIIFGTRGIKSKIKSGNFICPQCETDRKYDHKKVTKFFTLYFIPLIPLGSAGEYVECKTCKGTFIPRVLNYQRTQSQNQQQQQDQFLSEYEKAMKHSLVLMMLADGEIDDREMVVVLMVINKFGHNDITMEQLENYVAETQRNPQNVSTYLKKVGPMLNEHGKQMLIKCGLAVAGADGVIDDSEISVLYEMGLAMEMKKSEVKTLLEEAQKKQNASV